jgi:hypothetical protein
MHSGHRSLLLGLFALQLLSGCGSSSLSNTYGSPTTPGGNAGSTGGGGAPGSIYVGGSGISGTDDAIVATASVAGTVSGVVGASQTVSVTFTSSDGRPISGFAISGSTLPAGWSGQSPFGCASVSTGSGCVLNLTFAPTAVGSGTLTLECVFVDNADVARTPGTCLTLAYVATMPNNVIATASPTGQINAAIGAGSQSVSINFTTDDGNAATALTLTTSLTGLPSGWTGKPSTLSCAIVSTGSGCQLNLTYAPTTAGSGTLTLDYNYTDDTGAARTGALNIPYSTVTSNNVVAAASPANQINAIETTGSQAVAITFTTDDGTPATGLQLTSDLAVLPAGWSSTSTSFSCGSVSTGNGCQLHLTYAPKALTSGTLTLTYGYTDASGMARTGLLNIAYAATTNDNVIGTPAPMGQINAVVGSGSQPVTVTFTTDDGRPATALLLTSSLAALPAGWSSTATTFACSGLSTGNGCQLSLTYAPALAGSGTLTLSYSYLNNAGESKTGSVNIAYRATTHDNIVGNPTPSPATVVIGNSATVNVTFTTDDGNPASALLVTSALATLPSGWASTSGSFACSTVSAGAGCQLTLTYAPTAVASGVLALTYSYADDSGTAKTGSVSIPYSATPPPHIYIAQLSGSVTYCSLNTDGTLSTPTCATTGGGFTAASGIAFNGAFAYVADYGNNAVDVCSVGADGSLSGCVPTGGVFQTPWQLAISGTTLYATNASLTGGVTACAINADGTLSACAPATAGTGTTGIAISSSYTYLGAGSSTVDVCALGFSGCSVTGGGAVFSAVAGISIANGYAYVANEGNGTVSVCTVGSSGGLSACTTSAVGTAPMDVVINGSQAYVDDTASGNIYLCTVTAAGALTPCVVSGGVGGFPLGIQIAID